MSSSDEEDSSFEMETDDEYDEADNYYADEIIENEPLDFEHFEFKCLTPAKLETFLNESAEALSNRIHVASPIAKVLLRTRKWSLDENMHDLEKLLIYSRIKPESPKINSPHVSIECPVCFDSPSTRSEFRQLVCGHSFCISCWMNHFETQLSQGISTETECMESNCRILVPEDFALHILSSSNSRLKRYQQFALNDCVKSHPKLRYCPGANCSIVIHAEEVKSKRVTCPECETIFCFNCGMDYHAPVDCATFKKWMTKCADDSETANYIVANTKDCPKCQFSIEKNGGCNHIHCTQCKHHFCWICMGDWSAHLDAYRCSMYKPGEAHESQQQDARVALEKYLFYFNRWANHVKSLSLEERTLRNIMERTEEKVMNKEGTWIDWQYLIDASAQLAKCRYTLQYTYAYAYYMVERKELFEYQQAFLEREIEMLSWNIEHAEITHRAILETQMVVCEKIRESLLADFGERV
uniref:RBR-type E3 ubiquitin transferase n=1 Tax=Strigamia maritima TaxID=126957 RepID=T1IMH9_STRMM